MVNWIGRHFQYRAVRVRDPAAVAEMTLEYVIIGGGAIAVGRVFVKRRRSRIAQESIQTNSNAPRNVDGDR